MNSTVITWNLVRDPKLRSTGLGQPVAHFSVADNRRWQDGANQEWQEVTTYLDVVAWGRPRRARGPVLAQGRPGDRDRVTVTGRLGQRSWEDQAERRSKLELTRRRGGCEPPLGDGSRK